MNDPIDADRRTKRMAKMSKKRASYAQVATIRRLATQLDPQHPLRIVFVRIPVPLKKLTMLNAAVWIDSLRDANGLDTTPIGSGR